MTSLTRSTGARVSYTRPVTVQDLTGPQADVLWVVGDARTRGVLVRADPVREHPNGTVTVRVHHTDVVPLALPTLYPTPVDTRWHADSGDYLYAGLTLGKWVVGGAVVCFAVWIPYKIVTSVEAFLGLHGHTIANVVTGVVAAALLGLLLMLAGGGRGGGCVGLHCGGCKG